MALVLADRVRETTTVVGTGTATLLGAVAGYQSFTAVGNANTTYYVIASQTANEWEVGIGTYTASGTTLSRDTVLSSSNAGALVNFSAGTKDVWGDYPAGKAVTTDTLAYPPVIGNTTPNAATFTTLTATGQTSLGGAAGSEGLRVLNVASAAQRVLVRGQASAGSGAYFGASSTTDTDVSLIIGSQNAGSIRFSTARASDGTLGADQARITHTASAVNYVQVTGAATGGAPTISAQGSDLNVPVTVQTKGTSPTIFQNGSAQRQLRIDGTVNGANHFNILSGASGQSPILRPADQSTDTNVATVIQSRGTGAIDLAAGSSGVNISNGGTVTAITRTAAGSGYTSTPGVVISAPTTAGGVQAVATVAQMQIAGAAIQSGGTGYTVGDTLTVVGGTVVTSAATLTVTTVSAGVITGVSISAFTNYTALPTNPVSVTGGTGSGATFNLTWAVISFTIGTAGSGYVEQPTVTFSGGGGSGAAAVAQVGAGVSLRSLGGGFSFFTPAIGTTQGEAFRVYDFGGATWVGVRGHTGPTSPAVFSAGSANVGLDVVAQGSGSVALRTGGSIASNGIFNQLTQLQASHTASAVNYVQVTGAATGNGTQISAQGSDTNIQMIYASKGGFGHLFRTSGNTNQFSIAHVASTANFPEVVGSVSGSPVVYRAAGADTNIGLNLTTKGTGAVSLNTGGGTQFQVQDLSSATTAITARGGVNGGNAQFGLTGTGNTDFIQYTLGTGAFRFLTNGVGQDQMRITHTASAVNYVQVTGAATGGHPTISSQGSDSNARLVLNAKGSSSGIDLLMNNARQMFIGTNGSAVNYFQTGGTASGIGLALQAQGSDTNISQVFQSKGTGAIDLAAGSSGVNISNGTSVTAITRTANGSGYTSFPSLAISAPTTAGGVQATATVLWMFASAATVQAGGTGYTLNDVITVVGGTFVSSAATYTVTGVSAGVITSVSPLNFSPYTVLPTNPASVTGGTGSGATLNLTWGLSTAFTITNAGSGYVEQPTVTFSGGGGSGAAAYATVGSTPVIRSIGTSLSFSGPAGEVLRLNGSPPSGTLTDYLQIDGGVAGVTNGVYIRTNGSNTNNSIYMQSRGTGSIGFFTNWLGGGSLQAQVAHTASAVNYVQVTGAATGGAPAVTAQGSDSAIALSFSSKGGSAINFWTGGTNTTRALAIFGNSGNVVNGFTISPALAGGAPTFAVAGSDTNIDLALTPKGTGNVRFGTHTSLDSTTFSIGGYIEIKDSSGTLRKLAVIA